MSPILVNGLLGKCPSMTIFVTESLKSNHPLRVGFLFRTLFNIEELRGVWGWPCDEPGGSSPRAEDIKGGEFGATSSSSSQLTGWEKLIVIEGTASLPTPSLVFGKVPTSTDRLIDHVETSKPPFGT